MSDKIKEFIEVPQQFIRDGSQVSLCNLRWNERPELMFRDL